MPYFFDILDFKAITNENLRKHINIEGKIIYERKQRRYLKVSPLYFYYTLDLLVKTDLHLDKNVFIIDLRH